MRAGILLVATAAASTAAYQVMRPVVVDFGSALAVPLSTHGLYPAEDGYRWTNGQGEIALPSPGGGRAVRLDMVVSAWRPRGTPAPQLRVIAEGASVVAEPGPAPVALSLAADTGHSVGGALDVRLESERFVPSPRGSTNPRRPPASDSAVPRGRSPAARPPAAGAGALGPGRGAAPVLDRGEDRRRSRRRAFSGPACSPRRSSRSGSRPLARGRCGSCPRPPWARPSCCWSSPSFPSTCGGSEL